MKPISICATTAFLLGNILAAPFTVADQTDPIPNKGAPCLSCHGQDGQPQLEDVPILAGQQPVYLINAIKHYKAGERTGGQAPIMTAMVKDLTDAEIEALANWFGRQK